jgi:hypothetical protein
LGTLKPKRIQPKRKKQRNPLAELRDSAKYVSWRTASEGGPYKPRKIQPKRNPREDNPREKLKAKRKCSKTDIV